MSANKTLTQKINSFTNITHFSWLVSASGNVVRNGSMSRTRVLNASVVLLSVNMCWYIANTSLNALCLPSLSTWEFRMTILVVSDKMSALLSCVAPLLASHQQRSVDQHPNTMSVIATPCLWWQHTANQADSSTNRHAYTCTGYAHGISRTCKCTYFYM